MITHLKDKFNEEELKNALESILSELGWNSLIQIVKSKKRFFDRFTTGGFQLKAQNAQRARTVILNAAEKEDYEQLFFIWCQDKEALRSISNAWAETEVSGEGTDTEEATECQELEKEKFEKLIGIIKNREGLYFLCFSPVVFTFEQETRLLESVSLENSYTYAPKVKSQQESPKEKIVSEIKAENKECKAQLRKVQHENRKLVKECSSLENKAKKIELELRNTEEINRRYEEQIARLENAENEQIDKLETIIADQKTEIKGIKGMLDGLRNELRQREGDTNRLKEEKASVEEKFKSRIGDVLRELNSNEIIRSLNEPDEVKELLQSVIRIPSSDDTEKSLRKHINIIEFWHKLIERERASVKIVEEITLESASEPDFGNKWADLSDRLVDLKYSLRARGVIIGFFYEILRKFFALNESLQEETSVSQPITPVVKHKLKICAENVEVLGLEPKILKGIRTKNIYTVGDLVRKKDNELFKIKNFGKKDLEKLKKALAGKGLRLGMTIPDYY
jgi:hypothetical protein